MNQPHREERIRIGTLVRAGPGLDPVEYIRQILPHGFESIGIQFPETCAGVDLPRLAAGVRQVLAGTGVKVSTLGIHGNPLCDGPVDLETRADWRRLIDSAHLFECDIVSGFAGRVRGQPIDASMGIFKEVFWPLARRAQGRGVRIAFENCDMGGTWSSGDWNIATIPAAWEMMFDAVPADNLGLQWEPCHQMVRLIEPMPQLRRWVGRIFHLHGKDASVHRDVIREHGIHGPYPYAFHRTPGFGDADWTAIISELLRGGFEGSIDIEGWHDPVYRDELEMTGQVHALAHLQRCRTRYVPNPT